MKTKDRPERQSIEVGVGGVLMSVGIESGRRVVVNGGVPITCVWSTATILVCQDNL